MPVPGSRAARWLPLRRHRRGLFPGGLQRLERDRFLPARGHHGRQHHIGRETGGGLLNALPLIDAPRFLLVEYNIPRGCLAAYYPETNPLVPLESFGERSHTPTSKFIAIRVLPNTQKTEQPLIASGQ